MSTIVYLSNLQVQIVVGTAKKNNISIKQVYTLDAPEGSIINGMIMDVEAFTEFLRDTWEEKHLPKKDVVLVANSNKFVGRTIEMPILDDNRTYDYISREYADMGRDDFNFSFIHVKKLEGKRRKLYAEGVSPEMIQDYVDLFASIDIKLSAIYSGESSLITFTKQTLAKDYKDFVLIVADAITLTTILWIDGTFYYYNMARCFHEPGTSEYASDIARSLSQLTQFMKANQIEAKLEGIFIAGVDREDESLYKAAIMDLGIETPIKIYSFDAGRNNANANLQNYLRPISGLFLSERTQNFLVQYAKLGKKKKAQKNAELVKRAIIVGAVLVAMVAILITCVVIRNVHKSKLDKLNAINEDVERQILLMDYDRYVSRNRYLNSQYKAIHDIEENISTYPTGNSNVLAVFDKCSKGYATITHDSFDAESGIITITAMSAEVENINKFIKNLTEEEMFSDVDYTGYSFNELTKSWDVHVTCTLAEAAGR